MALDALRSTFSFRKSTAPAEPIPGWGEPAAPMDPPTASVGDPAAPVDDPARVEITAEPVVVDPPAWLVPQAPAADTPSWGSGDATTDDSPAAHAAFDTGGRWDAPAASTEFEVPPVPASLLAGAPAASAPPADPPTPAAAATSTYAADQYAGVFADPIAGGGTDTAAFGCPTCGRTLDRGTLRCEGCGTFLLLDLPLRRVGMLVGGGLVVGVLVMTLLVNLFPGPRAATAAGIDGATGGTGTGSGAAAIEIPTGAAAALRGTTAINGRLAGEATALRKALAAKKFKTGDVQKVLRRMAIDARAGSGMLGTLAAWPEAAGQQASLDAFYTDLQRQIQAGLKASVRSASPYKKAAKAVLATLERTPDLDADARTLAAQVGLELAPVEFPSGLR